MFRPFFLYDAVNQKQGTPMSISQPITQTIYNQPRAPKKSSKVLNFSLNKKSKQPSQPSGKCVSVKISLR